MNEDLLEKTALAWFESLGYDVVYGPSIAPGEALAERDTYQQVVLLGRLRQALEQINPGIPSDAIDDAVHQILHATIPAMLASNRAFHKLLCDGVDVSWMESGRERFDKVWILDQAQVSRNDFCVVNQFTILENGTERRPDVIVFVNGLPLAVLELKHPGIEKATLKTAFLQLQNYKSQISDLFRYNELLVISDGMHARMGSLSSDWDRFMAWRTVGGSDLYREPGNERQTEGVVKPGLEVLLKGVFEKSRFIDYLTNFITFEDDGGGVSQMVKKIAGYHQFHAVNKALACTLQAATTGDRKIGVVWHTQGSGKSLTMAFYAGKVIRNPAMKNPTLVVITDRNDLDQQLFSTFALNQSLLRQSPVQAQNRAHLKELLAVESGGVIFTTIQKFEEGDALTLRSNVVVIADEAHRSQYGFNARVDAKTGQIKYGFAQYLRGALPNASYIGYTGTPVELEDRNTPAVFGEYIDTYDIRQAVEDQATVPIYYESRLARLELREEERPHLDQEFEEITEDQESTEKERLKSKWAALESMVGTEKRLALIANDIINHYEKRQEAIQGKAMIVCMSRRICVALFDQIIALRPSWKGTDDKTGVLKIVMSGSSSDKPEFQPHIRPQSVCTALAKRFRNPQDELKLVIVRDMWLTGFDCPSMHTLYVDKPMGGHNLMQAIARVNRVFRDKPGGLVVDYLGLAEALKAALLTYTASGGKGQAANQQDEAVELFFRHLSTIKGILKEATCDIALIINSQPHLRLGLLASAMDLILQLSDGKRRFAEHVSLLSQAYALASPHPKVLGVREYLAMLQTLRAALVKATDDDESQSSPDMLDAAIQQLVSKAITSTEVVDVFAAAGLTCPDLSILSDEFLDEIRRMPQKNLAVEALKKLLHSEIRSTFKQNVVQSRSFLEVLEEAVHKYQNRTIQAAQVIEELIALAKELSKAKLRGESLGLNSDEVAFYDALVDNASARQILGDEKLKFLAQELVRMVRENYSIDWTLRENARAKIKVTVKRLLRKYGYPPDMEQRATDLVLEQAEAICKDEA